MSHRQELGLSRRHLLAAGAAATSALACTAPRAADSPASLKAPSGQIPTAIIMDDRATMIDFAGPWEAFQDATEGGVPGFHLYTVSGSRAVIQTTGNMRMEGGEHIMSGMKVTPDYTFADAPQPKVVVMGAQANHTPEKLEWIRKVAPQADIVMSVCTGAFILAKTGLIDGLEATTHHQYYDSFEHQFPKVKLVRGRRFVDNGKYVSAGGLTSGVDGALHVVSRYYGEAVAQQAADYMEHYGTDWKTGIPTRA